MMNWKFVLTAATASMILSCTHKETRTPAAVSIKDVISDRGVKAFSDIIGGDSPINPYRRPMKIDFYVDGDKDYLSETAKKALHQALTDSLLDKSGQGLAKVVASNLKEQMVENFVKTMRFYKLINVGLQMDISFLPEPNQKDSLESEMNSNQLVRFDELGKLSQKWTALETNTRTQSLYNNSVLVPVTSGQADLVGGAVTLYIEILDATPKFKLPRLTKNGVKGYIRYRRYYRMNEELAAKTTCDKYVISSQRAGKNVPLFYTLDMYKNFNIKNIVPTDETLEIFPGLLAKNSDGRHELMPKKDGKNGKSIPTGAFQVQEKTGALDQVTFAVEKIVYDLKDKSLDRRKSDVKMVSFDSRRSYDHPVDEGQALYNAKVNFFKKCESSLEKALKFDEIVQGDLL